MWGLIVKALKDALKEKSYPIACVLEVSSETQGMREVACHTEI